ncbi:MAG: hypothetical protein ABI689_01930 [Thermoanaerobaculia bacterium]
MRATFLFSVLAGAAFSGALLAGTAPDAAPRPISDAERAAVELARDFALRGPDAVWERLDPQAPLFVLGHDAAVLEISARLGSREGATWTLETPDPAYGRAAALFHLGFPSGADDLLRLEFASPGGGKVRQLWTLVDRPESGAGPARGGASVRSASPLRVRLDRALRSAAGVLAAVVLLLLLGGSAPFRRVRLAAGALLLASCAPTVENPGGRAAIAFEPRIGQLASQRLAWTAGETMVPRTAPASDSSPAAARILELWTAETALARGELKQAEDLLGPVRATTDPPLASLLRARLSTARFRSAAIGEFDDVALAGFASDQWRLEQIALASVLEEFPAASASAALASGSRLAEIWYLAAAEASVRNQGELAEARLRTAWSLRPLPRDEILAEPTLAALVARPALFPLFELGSPTEPRVRAEIARHAIALPAAAQGHLCGRHYSIRLNGLELELPGGASLAPAGTAVLDAASFRAEVERRALSVVGASPAVAGSASPARARLTEIAARALAREARWSELLTLTGGEEAPAGRDIPEIVSRFRALALRQLGHGAEATNELVRLAQVALAGRRPFPGALYDLAELVAADGRYDTAIRLVKKADAQVSRPLGEMRMKQFSLSLELERNVAEYRSTHFAVRFPVGNVARYGRQIATVLEEERVRMLQWIPPPSGDRVIVELLPLERFLDAYAGDVPVLGLFDGRVRMPLADIRSLEPGWIALVSHELMHALLAGATRGRAPHWLQEGLAQHAEMGSLHVNPMPALEASGRTLSFPALEPILKGFAEPKLVELAYSEAAWVVAFIEARAGAGALRKLAAAYAAGASTEGAIDAVLGLDLPAFDRAFRDWAVRRAPNKRRIAPRRFDRELDLPFSSESSEADAGRRAVDGMRVGARDAVNPASARESAAIRSWYETYLAATTDARRDRRRIEQAFRSGEGTPAVADCAALRGGALALVNSRNEALGAPDLALANDLRRSWEELGRFGELCEQGRTVEALDHYQLAVQALARATAAMRPFGLEP